MRLMNFKERIKNLNEDSVHERTEVAGEIEGPEVKAMKNVKETVL